MGNPSAPQRRKARFRERQAGTVSTAAARPAPAPPAPPVVPRVRPRRQFWSAPARRPALTREHLLVLSIVLVGFAVRIWDVGSRAMHGDEAVHAWLSWNLFRGVGYQYDPVYHGPLQFPVTALFYFLFGVSNVTGRLLSVLTGSALVALPYFLRRELGRPAALLASALIAISPSFVYVARLERDDSIVSFLTMAMVIGLFGFLRTRGSRYVYLAVTAVALSFSTMENTYITLFVFLSFVVITVGSEAIARRRVGEHLARFWSRTGDMGSIRLPALAVSGVVLLLLFALTVLTGWYPPVPLALGALMIALVHRQALLRAREPGTPRMGSILATIGDQTWLNAATIAIAIIFLLYSTFGTNLRGIWDATQPILSSGAACGQANEAPLGLNPCRKDILGGLFYWLAQHKVARGGQPWFYYTFLFTLYEQIAVVFGLGGMLYFLRRPTVFTTFLTYWAVLMFGIYSWAGEKFPWLTVHPLLPFLLIGAMFLVEMIRRPRWSRYLALAVAALLGALEVHSMVLSSFVNGANPVEMMVYVQSSPDTPRVAQRILSISNKATNGVTLPVTVDAADTWPFAWYLRDMTNVAYPQSSQLTQKPYSTNPVILVSESNQATLASRLTGYSGKPYTLRWWFPEDYKLLTWRSFFTDLKDPGYWGAVTEWLINRRPFGPRGVERFILYVKKGFVSPY